MASVTGRHMRPTLLLRLEGCFSLRRKIRSMSFLVLKASKHFLGLWKMYVRGQAVKEKRSYSLTFSWLGQATIT
jgi:hypothetical protein